MEVKREINISQMSTRRNLIRPRWCWRWRSGFLVRWYVSPSCHFRVRFFRSEGDEMISAAMRRDDSDVSSKSRPNEKVRLMIEVDSM